MEQILRMPTAISDIEARVSQPSHNLNELLEMLGITEREKLLIKLRQERVKWIFLSLLVLSLTICLTISAIKWDNSGILAFLVPFFIVLSMRTIFETIFSPLGEASNARLDMSNKLLNSSSLAKRAAIIRHCHGLITLEQSKMIGLDSDFKKTQTKLEVSLEADGTQIKQLNELIRNSALDYDLEFLIRRRDRLYVAVEQKEDAVRELNRICQKVTDYFGELTVLVDKLDMRLAYRLIIEGTEATEMKTTQLIKEADEAVSRVANMFWEHTKTMQLVFDKLQLQTQQSMYQVQDNVRLPALDTDLALKVDDSVALESYIEQCIGQCQTA